MKEEPKVEFAEKTDEPSMRPQSERCGPIERQSLVARLPLPPPMPVSPHSLPEQERFLPPLELAAPLAVNVVMSNRLFS